MDNSQDNNGTQESGEYKFPLVSPSELSETTTRGITAADIKEAAANIKKRQSISYKTEWQKSSERADKLSHWALIGWALAFIEFVWLIILISI